MQPTFYSSSQSSSLETTASYFAQISAMMNPRSVFWVNRPFQLRLPHLYKHTRHPCFHFVFGVFCYVMWIVFAEYLCELLFSSHPSSSVGGGVSCRRGPSLWEPSLQPPHGQPGPGPAGADANRLWPQRDRAPLLVLGPQRQPGLRCPQMCQVQRRPASAVPPARGHVRLVLPSPQHLVAVGRGGGGWDGAAGSGGGVLLHASHLGVSLTKTRCHDLGEVQGFWEDMEDAAVLRR